jgi:hypothetical protein
MEMSQALLYFVRNQGRKSAQEIHDHLCLEFPSLSRQEMAAQEMQFHALVKHVMNLCTEICLKKLGKEEAFEAFRKTYPQLSSEAVAEVWRYGNGVFSKCG